MMRSKSLLFQPKFSGVTVGGNGGGQPLPMVILTIIVLAMALITVFDSVMGSGNGPDLKKKIPFKCTSCQEVTFYTIGEIQKMQKPGQMGPMMGPLVLDCPKCGKHSLTQAVECPSCGNIFIMQIDPSKGMFDDKCPKCGISYAKAWQDKYKKENGEE